MAVQRVTGLPAALARVPFGVLRPVDARDVYAFPRQEFRRLEAAGSLRRLARGYYAVVPPGSRDREWRPSIEAAAYGIAASDYGPTGAALMGLSAARVHGAVPRALGLAIVAVPKQRPSTTMLDRPAEITFVRRDLTKLAVEPQAGDLGRLLVTTVEQTLLDLARRPELGGLPAESRAAVLGLWARADPAEVERLALEQRLQSAARRAAAWVASFEGPSAFAGEAAPGASLP